MLPILVAVGDSQLIEIVIGLLVVVAAVALLAERLKTPYPILLVIVGMLIGIIPGLPSVQLAPEYVFLLFLPPLLYYAGEHTTWRDFVANIRPISLLAIGLVVVTTLAVAWTARMLIPGMPWAAAVALGAIVSPPDAIAATAICERLAVPKRITTILEGESLVNDATALVLYRLAIVAAVSGMFPLGEMAWKLPLVAIGGVAIGLGAAWITLQVRRRVHEPAVEGTVALLTPFFAYLPAEWLHCSGVLAAVSAGVYMSRHLPRVLSPRSRLRDAAVWGALTFLLNGLIFVLIGLQLPEITRGLAGLRPLTLAGWSAAIAGVCIVLRVIWVFLMAWIPRKVVPGLAQRDPMPPPGMLLVIGWAGMRGIVTLAAAMALPHNFPYRYEIIFLSFALIMATLVLQGLSLPALIRFTGLGDDGTAIREERQARLEATHAALARLEVISFAEELPPEVSRRVRESYDERLMVLSRTQELSRQGEQQTPCPIDTLRRVHREVLIAERRMVTFLRDHNVIGDEVMRRLMNEIDLEEAKLAG